MIEVLAERPSRTAAESYSLVAAMIETLTASLPRAAQPPNAALLDHREQLALEAAGEQADLVEEQRPTWASWKSPGFD